MFILKDENILSLLATGVSLLTLPTGPQIPKSLELGLQYLQALAWERLRRPFPADWFWWEKFEHPIKVWWPGGLTHLPISPSGAEEGLLRLGSPTPLCREWAVQSRRTLSSQQTEIDERVMFNIWNECQLGHHQKLYVDSRRYLIEHSVVYEFKLRQASIGLHLQIADAYEPIPTACIKEDQVYLCPHCHDALIWQSGETICRNWQICQKHKVQKPQIVRADRRLLRARTGLFHYVVSPGLPELQLHNRLQNLKLDVELWPGVDTYDLRIIFPNGQRWAVDVKQFREAFCLGEMEAKKGFIPCPEGLEWDQAFYVISEFYDKSYKELFCRGAHISSKKLSAWNMQIASVQSFMRRVKTELEKCAK